MKATVEHDESIKDYLGQYSNRKEIFSGHPISLEIEEKYLTWLKKHTTPVVFYADLEIPDEAYRYRMIINNIILSHVNQFATRVYPNPSERYGIVDIKELKRLLLKLYAEAIRDEIGINLTRKSGR